MYYLVHFHTSRLMQSFELASRPDIHADVDLLLYESNLIALVEKKYKRLIGNTESTEVQEQLKELELPEHANKKRLISLHNQDLLVLQDIEFNGLQLEFPA